MLCSLSPNLGPDALKDINALEQDLGMRLLAFSCYDLKATEITPAQLAKIQDLEKRLGMSLVAVSS
ncbi:MAG: hypothetical protein ACOZF2_08150 [Thermodesulfobacteriota bacterium]